MGYRKLSREEASELHSIGAAVESRHLRRSPSGALPWEEWEITTAHNLEEVPHFIDEFRILIEE